MPLTSKIETLLTIGMHKKLYILTLFSLIAFLMASCVRDKVRNIPEVSTQGIQLNLERFESDLLLADTSDIAATMAGLGEKYPLFFNEIFLPRIVPVLQDPKIFAQYLKAPPVRQLLDTCQQVFGDFSTYENDFIEAFAFYKHYLPKRNIPRVITYTSEYSLGNFTYADSLLGIGLDFFLGSDYPLYSPDFFPGYIKRTMTPEYLVSKSIFTLMGEIAGQVKGGRLLDYMIHNGKIAYMLDHVLPNEQEHIKWEYTPDQMDWCKENELQIWAYLLDEELLYSTNFKDFQKLVDHSPNSPGMPPEAPGRTANWIGMQIIKAYMQRHPQTSWEQLVAMDDAQKLLNQSRYKPRR